jgi:hypothetical protein
MKKEFYIGQPLIVKETGDRVTFVYDDSDAETPCIVLHADSYSSHQYCEYKELEPSTEFKFSEIIAGLEQGYFDVGTEFRMPSTNGVITVEQGVGGLYVQRPGELLLLTSRETNSTWILVEPYKEMTLEEIEAELGYKIKLKDNGGN